MAFQPANLAPIYMAAFGDLGDSVAGAVGNYFEQRKVDKALEAAKQPDGSYDYNKLAVEMLRFDPKRAAIASGLAQPALTPYQQFQIENQRRQTDIQEMRANKPSPTQLKAKYDAEDDVNILSGSRASVERALELVKQGVYEGGLAGAQADVGTQWNYGNWAGDLGIVDPAKAQRTQEYLNLMNPEAMTRMADELAGSTSHQEMMAYKDVFSDPRVSTQTKMQMLTRILKGYDEKIKTKLGRIKEVGGASGGDDMPGGGLPEPGDVIDGYTYKGGDLNDPNSWEQQ